MKNELTRKRRPAGWQLPVLGLLVCLGVGFYGYGQGVATRNATPASRGAASGQPFLAKFTEIAAQAGLAMRFASGNETRKKYIIEANGSGVAFIDYDHDGRLDLFLVNGSRLEGYGEGPAPTNHLYRNAGGGGFEDVTKKAGMARSGWGSGVCAGDVDNDGNLDLYVTYWGPNVLYRNRGDGAFEDVTGRSGTAGPAKEWSSGCTFLDYDRDGRLDLLVTSYQAFDPATAPLPGKTANCEWKGMPVFCGPRGLPYGSMTLYHNRGGFSFEEVTSSSGVGAVKGFYAFTPVAADLNGDGWTDLYIACDSTPSILLRNNRDGTFTDVGAEAGVAFSEHGFEQGGMGVGVGDFDDDGRLDLIKTNFAGDYPNLFHNAGQGVFEDLVLRAGLAVNPQYVGWGVAFTDLDHDGLTDILQVNGHVYPELDSGTQKSQESYRNPRLVYRNLGQGRFEDVSALAGPGIAERKSSRGAAFGDFDNDGDIDLLVMNMGEGPSLLRNDLPPAAGHWINLRLEGTKSNRSAIGAVVSVEAAGRVRTEPVLSQSSYLSQNDLRLHFGLGGATRVDRITVRWPSGLVEEFPGGPADGFALLVEGSKTVKRLNR
ncbi:MAG TPA: CRTAC1 family protein [Blastocatellia bacterium]|nr:CRTAC1 family protein [Blastocatellia bacterium]